MDAVTTTAADQEPDPGKTTWAICWQAAVGRDFLFHPMLPERIRGRLIAAHQTDGRVLIDYLLLPSAIHAVVHIADGDSVGGVARAVGNVISRWMREAQPIRSPVFAGRYRAETITSVEDLRYEIRILAWRPVFLGLCTTPSHYARGALKIALGLATAQGYDSRPLLRHFGGNVPEARAGLRRWIRSRPSEQERRAWELKRGLELATGTVGPRFATAKPVNGPAAQLVAAGGSYDIDGALDLLGRWVSVHVHPGVSLDLHSASSAAAVRGRALVACIAVKHRLCSASSVARYFRRAKATLSEQMAACRARPTDRQVIETPVRRIIEECAALRTVSEEGSGPGSQRLHEPRTKRDVDGRD